MIAVQLRLAGVDVRAEIAGPCDPAHVTARFGGFFVKDIDDSSAWTVRLTMAKCSNFVSPWTVMLYSPPTSLTR